MCFFKIVFIFFKWIRVLVFYVFKVYLVVFEIEYLVVIIEWVSVLWVWVVDKLYFFGRKNKKLDFVLLFVKVLYRIFGMLLKLGLFNVVLMCL